MIAGMTAAEWRVVPLVARGLTNGEIASELFLAEQTVKFHIGNVLRKYGLRNRVELAVAFVRWAEGGVPWPAQVGVVAPRRRLCPCGQDQVAAGADECAFCLAERAEAA